MRRLETCVIETCGVWLRGRCAVRHNSKVDSKVSCDITVRFTARQGAGSERLKDAERDSRVIFRERERERERESERDL